MAEREHELHQDIESIAEATKDLRPADDFVDAVMNSLTVQSAADVLAKASRETADIEPSEDFTDAIMQSVQQMAAKTQAAEPNWQTAIVRFSRVALMGAAAAAAIALYLSSMAQSSFDTVILSDVDSIEVDE